LALAISGIYNYNSLQKTVNLTGTKSTELGISPLLFLTSTFFILGIGLLFLRVFPYIIRFIFWLGRNVWSPVFYVSFIQVGRSARQEQFLMLFIMFTLSIGIFNANAARTVNRNMEDRVNYSVGADITVQEYWPSNKQLSSIESTDDSSEQADIPIVYKEPPFSKFTKLSGVEMATKVLVKKDASVLINDEWEEGMNFMAITPYEFGKVAWFRNDLLPSHWYNYLNVLTKSRRAFIVSKNFKTEKKAKLGDTIYVKWGDQGVVEGIISGFVDYWPTYNPNPIIDKYGGRTNQYIVVANLSYVQQCTSLEPYQVWLKEKNGATDTQVYKDIEKNKIVIQEIKSSKQQIIRNKNDPMLQGTNGMLTLGFIITMIISALGFLIYWILSIQRRVLQFGIFRAMGLSMKKVIGMIICEQVLISGTAILMGIIIGGITSDLFIPILQIAASAAEQVPPFKIIAYGGDYIKIYIITAAMLFVGFMVLRSIIMRIKIDQALKLGED
jgi:putative ABC transport system permease protein